MASLLHHLDEVEALLRLGPTGLFLDLDGTLSHIVPRPEQAVVGERVKSALKALAGRLALVSIVSGRSVATARSIVGLDELVYVGSHGLEVLERGEVSIAPEAVLHVDYLRELMAELRARCRDTDAVFEEKHAAIAVHYRNSAHPDATRQKVMLAIEELADDRVRILAGRAHINILPPIPLTKGTAVRTLAIQRQLRSALVAGDDVTDIDAFQEVHSLASTSAEFTGLCVAVLGDESPAGLVEAADYTLADVDEMEGFLVWLAQG